MEPPVRAEHDDDRENGEQDNALFALRSFEVFDEREVDVGTSAPPPPFDPDGSCRRRGRTLRPADAVGVYSRLPQRLEERVYADVCFTGIPSSLS